MTLPEVLLWRALRSRPEGLKFRRQHPLGSYVLDFFCRDARVAIEIDGEAHNRGDRPQRDRARDEALRLQGIHTLRINAAAVLGDIEAVVRHIVVTASERLPLHHPALPDGPPPRETRGED
jgi:very-short-patch-repair endonuclease